MMQGCRKPSRIKFAAEGHLLRLDVMQGTGILCCITCGWSQAIGTMRQTNVAALNSAH